MDLIISKKTLNELKKDSNIFEQFIRSKNNKTICYILNRLGKLSVNFDKKILLDLTKNNNLNIRRLAIKNLGKLGDINLFFHFKKIALTDISLEVRREAVSAIGRIKHAKTIPFLVKMLKDSDSELVLQAIRGLLIFKNQKTVLNKLKEMKKHPNEIIQEIIQIEVSPKKEYQPKKQHISFPKKLKNRAILGDAGDIISHIPDESIHLTFTSPPYYNARDYSIYTSYNSYLQFLNCIFKEVQRITKPGRFFILNTSPIIIPRAGRKYSSRRYPIPYDIHHYLVKMGWDFIDDIIWLKPEASVKNRNAGFLQHRKPLAYKPNSVTEMLMVYRKKTNKLIDWNLKQYPKTVIEESKIKGKYETSNVWKINPAFDKVHSAIFPIEVCNRIIQMYSLKNDLVFDPFAGSGTLGKSALNLSRNFLIIEKNEEYFNRIQENIGFLGKYSNLKEFKKLK